MIEEYRHLTGRLPDGVDEDQLKEVDENGQMPERESYAAVLKSRALLLALYTHIHSLPPEARPTALCLSGGGIRSATFGLGVLQGLAAIGRLVDFRYLSTVSGGGYIGSWLSNWLRITRWDFDKVSKSLGGTAIGKRPPVGTGLPASPEPEQDPVGRLRAYSNFLSPVVGLSGDSLSLAATFLRNLVLNLSVWLPLIAAGLLLPRLFVSIIVLEPSAPETVLVPLTCLAIALVVIGIAYVVADLPGDKPPAGDMRNRFAYCCFLPVTLAALFLSVVGAWIRKPDTTDDWKFAVIGAGAHVLGITLGAVWRNYRGNTQRDNSRNLVGAGMVIASGALGGWLLAQVLKYGAAQAGSADESALVFATLSVPLMLGCFWFAMTLYAGVMRAWTTEDDREWWSRASAWWLFAGVAWVLCFTLVLYVAPSVLAAMSVSFPAGGQLTAGTVVLGIVTSAIGYWSKNGEKLKHRAEGLVSRLGSRLLSLLAALVILAVLLTLSLGMSQLMQACPKPMLAYQLCDGKLRAQSNFVLEEAALAASAQPDALPGHNPETFGQTRAYVHVLLHSSALWVLGWLATLALFAVVVSWAIGANTFSLHGMYGNRLVRAYLGSGRSVRHPHWMTGFDSRDNVALWRLRQGLLAPAERRLFPVINMALNLVLPSDRRLAWQQRKAASFTATPLHCGSEGTGYARTQAYGAPHGGMTLGRALTISGAAAAPNMGYHSSAFVTLVMTLFNVRLGWWLSSPAYSKRDLWRKPEPRIGLKAMLDEAFGRTTDDRSTVYLSDGGHFENLGLYEMVRRRCYRILVVDATCDPSFEYADLHSAVRKIRVDFGLRIDLPDVLPGQKGAERGPRLAVARVRYSDRDEGIDIDGYLYIIKPMLVGSEPPDVTQYAVSASTRGGKFPHQSTSDQFFDETQFESYRVLGLQSVRDTLPRSKEWPSNTNPIPAARTVTTSPLQTDMLGKSESGDAFLAPGLMNAVQTIGPGMALASALTIGGTLGVAGTVSLMPAEISLSKTDRELLRDGLTFRAKDGSVPLTLPAGASISLRVSEADAATLTALSAGMVALSRNIGDAEVPGLSAKVQSLTSAVSALLSASGVPPTIDTALAERIERAASQVSDRIAPIGLATRGIVTELGEIRKLLPLPPIPPYTPPSAPTRSSAASAPASLETVVQQLKDVNTKLESLNNAVAAAAPRRNVRGQ